MPDQPRKPPKTQNVTNFASLDPLSRTRRRSRWALHPTREPNAGEAADAGRFATEAELLRGLGRKHEQS